jgi:hypothetical protein
MAVSRFIGQVKPPNCANPDAPNPNKAMKIGRMWPIAGWPFEKVNRNAIGGHEPR